MLREAEDSGGKEEASTPERPAQVRAGRRRRRGGLDRRVPHHRGSRVRRSGAGRPLVRGCALAAACRGAPGRVVRSVLVVRSGQGRARAPRPEPPRAAGRRAGQALVVGRLAGRAHEAGPVSAEGRRAGRAPAAARHAAKVQAAARHAGRAQIRALASATAVPEPAPAPGAVPRSAVAPLAGRQHRKRVDVPVPRARFAHAEVQVRLDGRARARRPDSPHALARRDARAGANGKRGEVQVRGVETVGGPDAHGQTRGPGRADEANLAARRGHDRACRPPRLCRSLGAARPRTGPPRSRYCVITSP